MSDSAVAEDLVIEEPSPTRVARQVPDRQLRDDVDPEAAVTEAMRNATDGAAREVAAANERTRLAEEARVRAENQVSQTAASAMSAHEQALLSKEAAITQTKASAISALRAARESGNFDAEVEAQQLLSQASYDLSRVTHDKQAFANEKARLANQQRPSPTSQQQGQPQTTPEAQRWLDTHPRYYTDDEYKADAIAAHTLALSRGIQEGSGAYVNFIEGRMTKLYGDGHGQDGGNDVGRRSRLDHQGRPPQRMDSSAARPGGGGGHDDRGGDSTRFRHDKGEVRIIQVTDPKTGNQRDSVAGTVPAQWVEFAKIAKMPVDVYAAQQIRIQTDDSLSGLHYRQNGVYK